LPADPIPKGIGPEDDLRPRPVKQLKRSTGIIPGYLWPFAVLPWGLLLLALGGCVWGFLGGLAAAILSAAGVGLTRARWISVGMRLAGLLALDGVAILAAIVALVVANWAHFTLGPGSEQQQPMALTGPWANDIPLPPTTNVFADGPRVYLADLQEFGVREGPSPFGKNGTVADGQPIQVGGIQSPKGLSMHPPWAPKYAAARYRLGRQAAVFRATAAINDTCKWCWSPAVFTVLADGKPLWQSSWIGIDHTHSQECSLNVSGVDVLELRVHCINGSDGVYTVWFEPRVLQSTETPDEPPVKALFAAGPRAWLSDMDPIFVRGGPWPLSKNGTIGPERKPIEINGVPSPKGLGMHPPDSPGATYVRYRLGKQAAIFKAMVALNDTATIVNSQAVFEVYGDGKRLWQSAPVKKGARAQECSVVMNGVDVLELRVSSQGSNLGLHTVWLEPRLLQAADTPDK
jgi:hypothetical protein